MIFAYLTVLLLYHWLTPLQRYRFRMMRLAARHLDRNLIEKTEQLLYNYKWSDLMVRSIVTGDFPSIFGEGLKPLRDIDREDEDWWEQFAVSSRGLQ